MAKSNVRNKKPQTNIIYMVGSEDRNGHRVDLETCPECQYIQNYKTWINKAHTLCLEPRYDKPGYISVTTECPKCFRNSWVHVSLDSAPCCYEWSQEWKDAIITRSNELKLNAMREWAYSQCGKCGELISGSANFTTQKECSFGRGEVKRNCPQFKSIELL